MFNKKNNADENEEVKDLDNEKVNEGEKQGEDENTSYKLMQPLKVNGEKITEIPYDFEAITAKDIMQVSRDLKSKGVVVMVAQFDDENLINLFAKAVTKVNKSIILNDLMRLSAKDTFRITALTRSFFYKEDLEDTQEK